jgi:acetate kinase
MSNTYRTNKIPSQYVAETLEGGEDGDVLKVSITFEISHRRIQRLFEISDYTTRQVLEAIKNNPGLLNLHRSFNPEISEIVKEIHKKDPFAEIYDTQYRKSNEKPSTQYALEA